jgi:IS5 family transposase
MRFLDLSIADDIPDSKTVWNFREQLIVLGAIEELFALFTNQLEKLGLIINEGKILDASFIEVPKQRNSRDENQQIKEGKTPESFLKAPTKLAQKDVDARWTKKNGISYFGYKNHVKVDSKSKIITGYQVSSASVHDSQPMEDLLDDKDALEDFYADSAYTGQCQEKIIKSKKMHSKVCEKGYRNKPLTDVQKENNRKKSSVRSRVEHIFGFMEMSMNEMYLYNIGIKRISGIVGLMNLTYNMFRKIQLKAI